MSLFSFLGVLLFVPYSLSFNFKQLSVQPSTTIIGQASNYYILFQRYIDNQFSQTSWSSDPVLSGSTITVSFPAEYTLGSPTCLSVVIQSVTATGYTCTASGNTITVSGAIPSVLFISTVQLIIGNIINPVPAVYTGEFQGTIGVDVSLPNGGGIQLTAANFTSCSITFDTNYVNQTSALIVTVDPKNSLDSTAKVTITVSGHYANDISGSFLPITNSMTCTSNSSGVATSPTCTGNSAFHTITASNLITGTLSTIFSFRVVQFKSPPTLQPSEFFTITSFIGSNQVDTCTVYPTGLAPNPFTNITISSIQTMKVNTEVGLRIQMTLADFVNNYDDLQVIFPSQILPTYVNLSGIGIYNITQSSVTGQSLNVIQRRINRLYAKGSIYILNFYKIKAPPSTKTTNQITLKILRNGFEKMVGYASIKAIAGSLTGAIAVTNTTVNQTTSYKINVTLNDVLSSSGMIRIVFPATITPTLATGCATLIGISVKTTPTCFFDNMTNTITILDMNSSYSQIPIQTLMFTIDSVINPPSTNPSGSFSVISYYTNDMNDLVALGNISGLTATDGNSSNNTNITLNATDDNLTVIFSLNLTINEQQRQKNQDNRNDFNSFRAPVPFTIGAIILGLASLISKFQHSDTFLSGSLYSIWSLLQWGSLGLGAYLYYNIYKDELNFTEKYIQAIVFITGIGIHYLLNILAILIQNCALRKDMMFNKWLEKQTSNLCFYTFSSILGVFTTHKFKNILFCKMFGINIFKARLDSVQSFRIFNAISFLSIISSLLVLFSASSMIYKHKTIDQEFMAYFDIISLTVACIVLSILNSRKGSDYFDDKDQFILRSNKIANSSIIILQQEAEGQEKNGTTKQAERSLHFNKFNIQIQQLQLEKK